MIDALPQDWFALLALVFVLGLKHGLDADHLATIDGLTRYNSRNRPRLARWCGLLFSLGHGLVVLAISVLVSTLTERWNVPSWTEDLGAWISFAFLTALGLANLHAVFATPAHVHVQMAGLKSGLFRRFRQTSNPVLITLIGALFALSFDTMSQTSLFALTATRYGGYLHALTLGGVFSAGMLLADSANGFWISRLISRADRIALVASRMMGLAVASISLMVAAVGAAKYFDPRVAAWSSGKELAMGLGVIATLTFTFVVAGWLTRTDGQASPTGRN